MLKIWLLDIWGLMNTRRSAWHLIARTCSVIAVTTDNIALLQVSDATFSNWTQWGPLGVLYSNFKAELFSKFEHSWDDQHVFNIRKFEPPEIANSFREGINLYLLCLLISPPEGLIKVWEDFICDLGLKNIKVACIILFLIPFQGLLCVLC